MLNSYESGSRRATGSPSPSGTPTARATRSPSPSGAPSGTSSPTATLPGAIAALPSEVIRAALVEGAANASGALDDAMEAVGNLMPGVPASLSGGGASGATPAWGAGKVEAVRSSLALLSRVALRGEATSVSLSFIPPAAATAASFCGPALALSSAPLPLDGGVAEFLLPIVRALPPCAGASMPKGTAAAPLTLPASLVVAQPPPSVAVSRSLQAELSARGAAYAGASLSVVQWGVSPVSETAGLATIRYKPLVKPGTLAAEADAVMANVTALGGGFARRLGFISSLFATLQAIARGRTEGASTLSPTGATVATNAALRAAAPRPTFAYDRLPSRPLDSHIVSVTLTSRAGAPLPAANLAAPFLVTIPLRDLSIVQWDSRAGAATGFGVGNTAFTTRAMNVTCPSSPETARAGVAAVFTAPPSLAGMPAVVTLASVAPVSFSAATDVVREALSANVGFGGDAVGGSGDPPRAAGAPPTRGGATSYLLSTDCGAPFGVHTFMCGPGSEGARVTFSCPTVSTTPVCLWFDTVAAGWSIEGCEVANVTETAVTCACSHLTDFAVRFAALDLPDNDLFAVDAPVRVVLPPDTTLLLPAVVATLCAATLLGAAFASAQEGPKRALFAARVAADGEVALLARALAGASAPKEAALTELLNAIAAGGKRAWGPKVAPSAASANPTPLIAELLQRDRGAGPLRDMALLLTAPIDPLRVALALEEREGQPPRGLGSSDGALPAALVAAQRRLHLSLTAARALWWALSFERGRHPLTEWLLRFDPLAPSPLRALALGAALAASLWAGAGWYARSYSGAEHLPPLGGASFLAVASICAMAAAFFHATLNAALVRAGGAAAWAARFPVLAAEQLRRRAVAASLAVRSNGALLSGVADAVGAQRGVLHDPALADGALPALSRAVSFRELPLRSQSAAAQLRAFRAAAAAREAAATAPARMLATQLSRVRVGAADPPSRDDVRAAWEAEEGAHLELPPCTGRLARAAALDDAFEEWLDTSATLSSAEPWAEMEENEVEAPDSEVVEDMRYGWEAVLWAHERDAGGSPAVRSRHLGFAAAPVAARGGSCGPAAASLALLLVLALSAYFAAAFGVLRGDTAARSLLGAWALGVALAAGVLHPVAVGAAVGWHVLLWPRLAPVLDAVPIIGSACGARAAVGALRATALPAEVAISGRLALLLQGFAPAAASESPLEVAIVAAVGLPRLGAALHGRAHWAAAAGRGAELRGALLAARAGAPLLVAPPPQLPQRLPAPQCTPKPPALSVSATPPQEPMDALDRAVVAVGARALAWEAPSTWRGGNLATQGRV